MRDAKKRTTKDRAALFIKAALEALCTVRGRTDSLADPDPLGAQTPHSGAQVKHRARSGQKATREEIASLREARQGGGPIDLMDLNGLLEKWTGFYDRLTEEDKGHLRLRRVLFLATE